MSLSNLASEMLATQKGMIGNHMSESIDMLKSHFDMVDGDYIRFNRRRSSGFVKTIGRILQVNNVYWNQSGGVTAALSVIPMLQRGGLGNSMNVIMVKDADGDIRHLSNGSIEKVTIKKGEMK